jgi:hypothetical protein
MTNYEPVTKRTTTKVCPFKQVRNWHKRRFSCSIKANRLFIIKNYIYF